MATEKYVYVFHEIFTSEDSPGGDIVFEVFSTFKEAHKRWVQCVKNNLEYLSDEGVDTSKIDKSNYFIRNEYNGYEISKDVDKKEEFLMYNISSVNDFYKVEISVQKTILQETKQNKQTKEK